MVDETPLPAAVKWRGALAVLSLVMLAVGTAQTSAGHALLRKAGLFEQPTSYTSLAFQRPQSLPQQLASRQASVPVSVLISNVGPASRTYQWALSVVQGTATHRVASGSIRVAPNRRATLNQTAHVVCNQQQVSLVVSLADPAESVHDLLTCPPATRSSSSSQQHR